MGDLDADTRVRQVDEGRFSATLSPDWEIWGPNGGYLASVALRAGGVAAQRARPASISAHFVGAGRSGAVDIATRINRSTRVATSVSVEITQDDRPWLVATVWGVDDDLTGLEHHSTERPDVPRDPDQLPSAIELLGDRPGMPHPFWTNLDQRPLTWVDDWDRRVATDPRVAAWVRFVPSATFDDPWVDACRSLILIDLDSWPSATRPHVGELEHYAPTIEVTARFIASTSREPWLLTRASSPRATGGLIVSTGEIWTRDLQLAAIGGSTLLCRPAARRPDR